MKNSASDQSFYIDSEEEDEENVFGKVDNEGDGNDSDSSASSAEDHQQNKPGSYNTSWPQSYRFPILSFCHFPLFSSAIISLSLSLLLHWILSL